MASVSRDHLKVLKTGVDLYDKMWPRNPLTLG